MNNLRLDIVIIKQNIQVAPVKLLEMSCSGFSLRV